MGRVVSEAVWQERRGFVARWRASGLALAEFARREGVACGQALAWRARFLTGETNRTAADVYQTARTYGYDAAGNRSTMTIHQRSGIRWTGWTMARAAV